MLVLVGLRRAHKGIDHHCDDEKWKLCVYVWVSEVGGGTRSHRHPFEICMLEFHVTLSCLYLVSTVQCYILYLSFHLLLYLCWFLRMNLSLYLCSHHVNKSELL